MGWNKNSCLSVKRTRIYCGGKTGGESKERSDGFVSRLHFPLTASLKPFIRDTKEGKEKPPRLTLPLITCSFPLSFCYSFYFPVFSIFQFLTVMSQLLIFFFFLHLVADALFVQHSFNT